MSTNSKNSRFSTLMLMVLKEIRLERGVHQGLLAQAAGKSPSAWTKIENGQSPLTLDVMFGACAALQLQPSYAMTLVERLVNAFNSQGYYFHSENIESSEDELLPLMIQYFNSKGYEALKNRFFERTSITALGNPFSPGSIPTIIEYCCDPNKRTWIDDGALLSLSGPSTNDVFNF